jgi:hypothetical protein
MFLKLLEAITGKQAIRPGMDAVTSGKVWLSELQNLAAKTRRSIREAVKLEPGKKNTVILTDDLDLETGKLYPDYKERRAAREKTGSSTMAVGSWDVYPD